MASKPEIRREALSRRDALATEIKKEKDSRIREFLLNLPAFSTASFILFYASFKSEVDTLEMIRRSLAAGKRVAVPKVERTRSELLLYEIESMRDLVPGYFGIPEPAESGERMRGVHEMDLLIIPGVAFDGQCNRLGYGKGFYDKLLRLKRSPAVALAYEEQLAASIPAEPHDIKMDSIITDTRILCNYG